MKQKLLTLATLLLCAVSGAWAADFVDAYGALGTVTGDYIADGISKITLGENATANSGIEASGSDKTLKFTVSTPDGFTIKTVRFKDSNVNEANISCNDATGTLATASHYTTLTASEGKTSIEFTIPSASGKKAKITELTITVSSSTTDDYELITPQSISDGVISYTSSLGDDKLVTAMAGVGGPSCSAANLNFGNGKGFSLTTSRAIKAVYCVWYQRCPMSDDGWKGYSDAGATKAIGSYSVTTNAWTAGDDQTKFVAFKSSEGSTHRIASIHIFYYPDKAISTEELGGVKKGIVTLTESTDWSVSGNIITLTDLQKAVTAPEDIKLINHITYTDASTNDKDVTVTFDGTITAGYFVSDAATIGGTDYTVKVPVDLTPTLILSATEGELNLKSYQVGSIKVTVTGSNLTGDTFTAPTVDGVTITPATATITEGSFSQEFTIKTTATTAASTVIGFAHTGATTQNYTLTYSKTAQRSLAQVDVTATTIWDWTKAGENVTLKDDGTTDPAKNEDFLLSNIAEITNDANFNSQALFVNLEHAKRDNLYMQGSSVSFNAAVPGTVSVTFSNTGNRNNDDAGNRYVYVNGVNSGVSSWRSSDDGDNKAYQTAEMEVAVGAVTITAKTGEGDDTMIRIKKITFTPATATATIATSGYTTLASEYALDFANATGEGDALKAYAISSITKTSVMLTEVTQAPAGEGLILKGSAGKTYTIPALASAEAITNELSGAVAETAVDANSTYALSGGVFKKYSGTTIPAGKAYLLASKIPVSANELALDFGEGDVTGIQNVEKAQVELLKGDFYNLAGQRVAQPAKGLYIVNGKKVILK